LTIAKYLVEAHGGQIQAESEGAGKGSRFSFSLKVAQG
jgi:signal transduction histidine kinase